MTGLKRGSVLAAAMALWMTSAARLDLRGAVVPMQPRSSPAASKIETKAAAR